MSRGGNISVTHNINKLLFLTFQKLYNFDIYIYDLL